LGFVIIDTRQEILVGKTEYKSSIFLKFIFENVKNLF